MSEKTVFVIQDVHGKNLLPAKDHGKLHVILSGRENPADAAGKLTTALMTMRPDDFLLLIGHPLNIVLAGHIAINLLGNVNFLVWDRINYTYQIERVEYEPTNIIRSAA